MINKKNVFMVHRFPSAMKHTLMMKTQWCETECLTASKQKNTVLCFNCSHWGPETHIPELHGLHKWFSMSGE